MTEERFREAKLYRNAVSFYGALIAGAGILLILFAIALELTAKKPSPYLGIFTFMVFPAIFFLGVLVFLYGMRRESLRRRREGAAGALPYPRFDLTDPAQRKRLGYISMGGVFVTALMAFIAYNAFHYSESVSFCGTLCHTVMKPEHTAYLNSPHARVGCVDCHIGEGAEWFVKAKISGLRQVAAVAFNSYPRPIPTPVENLRPARETCEECHWPAKFFWPLLKQRPHFRYDEKNTAEQITLGVKTGGGSPDVGGAGIHWHMVIANRITFVAADRKKQDIPYIEVRDAQGNLRGEYTSADYKGKPEDLSKMRRYTLDCMDCHNRPTHVFEPPDTAVDRAMTSGFISRDLPWAKKVVVDALTKEYPSNEKAREGLTAGIDGFYRSRYPDIHRARRADVDKAVAKAIEIYGRSVFPEMKVDWKTYSSNISHKDWPGCFRCHDGKHVARGGKTLTMECTACHTEPVRSPLKPMGTVTLASHVPWHPVPLEGKHARILCSRCHSAGYRPSSECSGCHKFDTAAPMGTMACSDCHRKAGEAKPTVACGECHEPGSGLLRKKDHAEGSCTDCHRPHGWAVEGRDVCLQCHDDRKEHNAPGACAECHDFRPSAKK